ncbi:MAG: hypothetical protein OJF49_003167 [Ktedonobacterales bacterium]|nr:MAG: hypothetical protein OJF49_003167 [Ktedonobacterales bacterium]
MLASIPLWLSWNFEPVVVLALVAPVVAYFYALGPLRRRYFPKEQVDRRKVGFFVVGMALLAVALLSPLETVAMSYLLTAHMLQHMFLSVICPPLILLGLPGWMIAPLFRGPVARRVIRALTHPVVAFGLYNLNMWVWHLPPLFDSSSNVVAVGVNQMVDNAVIVGALLFLALWVAPRLGGPARAKRGAQAVSLVSAALILGIVIMTALGALSVPTWGGVFQAHNPLHTLMTAMFFGTAMLYWMPILSPIPEIAPRLAPTAGMLYMFLSTQPMMALGALLTFASNPLYARYAGAPLILGFTRLGDQQFAGLTMWLPMDIPLIITISILFFKWIERQDYEERLAAGEFDEFYPAPPLVPTSKPE